MLDTVITDKVKHAALRKYGRVVIDGAVFEAKDKPGRYTVTMDNLS
ncbi:hypothetical protein [Granulicella arctica]|nr:hypothetical protein [Granulicella arctica]